MQLSNIEAAITRFVKNNRFFAGLKAVAELLYYIYLQFVETLVETLELF